MKKTSKKATLQTLDKKIDTLGQTLDKKIDTLGQTLDKKIDTLTETVDVLARSTNHGFDAVFAFQKDMIEFAQKTSLTLFNLDSHARTTNERLDAIEKALPPLGNLSEALKREVLQLNVRVGKIEARVGIKTI